MTQAMSGLAELAGKVAVVTGGASGIGRSIARRLVLEGMQVIIADVEREPLAIAARQIGATAIPTDVTSPQDMQDLAAQVQERFGGVQLFCSNAGVASTARILDMALPDWQWLLDVNLYGLIHGIKAFVPLLAKNADRGHLAITASLSGFHVTPELGGYTVSKFAVIALAETLALEMRSLQPNVGVTILCPGPVSTRLGASQRNRPVTPGGGALVDRDLEAEGGDGARWLDPGEVATVLLQAIRRGDLYAVTHPEWAPIVQERHDRIMAAFRR
jgi:NAD(P)-dependent dehydrogenase (short-subunit alcohol dehydrogenase family)